MHIGILGAGSIGATLTRRLSESGHEVKVANSRGPDTIDPALLIFGARAVEAADVAADVDVLICSIPFNRMPGLAPLVAQLSPETVVIDTSNYYPHRDGGIPALDSGQVESVWIAEMLGRPIAKAWNAIGSDSFADKATEPGTPGRIAIPVAAERATDRAVALQLVEVTGFDAFDAASIEDSWRQQPAAPVYCTDLTRDQMSVAITTAEKESLPRLRDLTSEIIAVKTKGLTRRDDGFGDWLVQLNRAIYM